jgi:hypothetical protein
MASQGVVALVIVRAHGPSATEAIGSGLVTLFEPILEAVAFTDPEPHAAFSPLVDAAQQQPYVQDSGPLGTTDLNESVALDSNSPIAPLPPAAPIQDVPSYVNPYRGAEVVGLEEGGYPNKTYVL